LPSPVAHTASGFVFYLFFCQSYDTRIARLKKIVLIFLLVGLANLPDLDFFPGFLIGEPNRYHHGISHSLITAILLSTFVYWGVKNYFTELESKKLYALLLLTLSSHTVLDYFVKDTVAPYGVPLFWPLSSEYFISPFSLFMGVSRSGESAITFIASLFSKYNLISIAGEIFYSLTIILIALLLKNRNSNTYQIQLLIAAACSTVIFITYGVWVDLQAS
jgi:inner membrane protein